MKILMITKNKKGFYSSEIGIIIQCICVVHQIYVKFQIVSITQKTKISKTMFLFFFVMNDDKENLAGNVGYSRLLLNIIYTEAMRIRSKDKQTERRTDVKIERRFAIYLLYVQEVVPILYSNVLHKMGHYFLDTQWEDEFEGNTS